MTDDEIIAAYDSQIGAGAGYHRAGLRAVERAARAAAEVCEGVHRHRDSLGLSHGYNAIMDCVDALRARAEVDGEGGR